MKKNIYSKKISYPTVDFFKQYKHLSKQYSHHVLLESGRGGRYSVAAFAPRAIAIGSGSKLEIFENGKTVVKEGNPLHQLKIFMGIKEGDTVSPVPLSAGGAVGFISYDYARYIEKLPEMASDELQTPDVYFFLHDEWFVLDHEEGTITMFFLYGEEECSSLEGKAEKWEQKWLERGSEKAVTRQKGQQNTDREVSIDEAGFMNAVERVKSYIAQGDVFQVNLSVRQTKQIEVPAIDVYEQLRIFNPSPYMGYFHTPEFQLVSGSPELLVKKYGSTVSTRPIAGTRSRGGTPEEDEQLAKELIENEKERAEHVMLVDLERNDLGRVSKYGTVEVNEFMVIERYSHVMHIVSNVQGEIAPDKDGFDLIDATFPGGTITGAPKVRTMEIIEELEPSRRGPYTGSMGWIGFDGDLELNIMIRTMLVKDGQAHVQAGAGIVIDSIPKNEYKESLKKAKALWKAKELAETGEFNDLHD